jgi:hypothetical protein
MTESGNAFAKEPEPLSRLVDHLLEESRMVLRGIQALFGFQLIAVFNQTFWDRLTHTQHIVHLVSLSVIALSIALVMTPAAYHRQTERETISRGFVRLASRLLLWSMVPLLVGMCLDFYLIASLILKRRVKHNDGNIAQHDLFHVVVRDAARQHAAELSAALRSNGESHAQ